jgi:putative oxidoreductase
VKMQALPPMWGITVVRVMAGIILFVAALEKFNGGGFDGFTKAVTGMGLPLPQVWGVFIPLLELIGGALILVGLGARWVAAFFIVEFAVTSFVIKAPRQPPFGGWDSMRIDLMLLAASITVLLVGPGALALESVLARSRRRADSSMSAGRSMVT